MNYSTHRILEQVGHWDSSLPAFAFWTTFIGKDMRQMLHMPRPMVAKANPPSDCRRVSYRFFGSVSKAEALPSRFSQSSRRSNSSLSFSLARSFSSVFLFFLAAEHWASFSGNNLCCSLLLVKNREKAVFSFGKPLLEVFHFPFHALEFAGIADGAVVGLCLQWTKARLDVAHLGLRFTLTPLHADELFLGSTQDGLGLAKL